MLIPLVRPPDVGFAEFRFDLAPPPHPHAVAAVRHLLRDALAVIGLNSDAPCSLLTELLTNAIRHGGAPSVILDLYDGQLFIVVTDPSTHAADRTGGERPGGERARHGSGSGACGRVGRRGNRTARKSGVGAHRCGVAANTQPMALRCKSIDGHSSAGKCG